MSEDRRKSYRTSSAGPGAAHGPSRPRRRRRHARARGPEGRRAAIEGRRAAMSRVGARALTLANSEDAAEHVDFGSKAVS